MGTRKCVGRVLMEESGVECVAASVAASPSGAARTSVSNLLTVSVPTGHPTYHHYPFCLISAESSL
jgi:hypothetical protein